MPSPVRLSKRFAAGWRIMNISERAVGGVTIVDVDGRITVQDGADEFHAFLRRVLHQRRFNVVLNLERVPYVDSTALGAIVRAYTTATRLGGTVKLLHVTGRVQELLVITRLAAVFDSFDTEADAIGSFGAVGA
jgi:anti-sigma B factor antagonist